VGLVGAFVHHRMRHGLGAGQPPVSIGVITPYAQQRTRLNQALDEAIVREKWAGVTVKVATVDGFQGGEKDLIVFSCVRGPGSQHRASSIGFLADIRRMNVALTRAKYACWVVGNSRALTRDPNWAAFLKHCMRTKTLACMCRDRLWAATQPDAGRDAGGVGKGRGGGAGAGLRGPLRFAYDVYNRCGYCNKMQVIQDTVVYPMGR
jgi:hypothetical protein